METEQPQVMKIPGQEWSSSLGNEQDSESDADNQLPIFDQAENTQNSAFLNELQSAEPQPYQQRSFEESETEALSDMQPINIIKDLFGGLFILLDAANWLYTTVVVLYHHKPTDSMFNEINFQLAFHLAIILIIQGFLKKLYDSGQPSK